MYVPPDELSLMASRSCCRLIFMTGDWMPYPQVFTRAGRRRRSPMPKEDRKTSVCRRSILGCWRRQQVFPSCGKIITEHCHDEFEVSDQIPARTVFRDTIRSGAMQRLPDVAGFARAGIEYSPHPARCGVGAIDPMSVTNSSPRPRCKVFTGRRTLRRRRNYPSAARRTIAKTCRAKRLRVVLDVRAQLGNL